MVTIGTFDWVHLGHRKVIDKLKSIAARVQGENVLFTFYPHTRLIVSGNENILDFAVYPDSSHMCCGIGGVGGDEGFDPITESFFGVKLDSCQRSISLVLILWTFQNLT